MISENSKKLVVDVSTLLKWSRPPVGIIRTQLEFIDYLLKNNRNSIYFKFNDDRNQIIEVEKKEIERKVNELFSFINKTFQKTTQEIIKKKDAAYIAYVKKAKFILNTEGINGLLIRSCKKICPVKIKNILKSLYIRFNLNKTIGNIYQNETYENKMFQPEIVIASQLHISFLDVNSIIVSIGLDWDYSNYSLLYWLKKKYQFKFVGAFYDAIPIVNPEFVQSFYFAQRFFYHLYYLIHLSDKIFCISDFSRNQLVDICVKHNIKKFPILKTIRLGDSAFKNSSRKNFPLREHKQNYVLYVSTIESRKNHILLLKVWQKLQHEKFCDIPDLVIVGMIGWGVDELFKLYNEDKNLQTVIHFYYDVEDDELAEFYKNAKFTAFPSYMEGWGLGAVESMLYGKPCIISNCHALIEATQGLMPSAPPEDIETWYTLIKDFSFNEKSLNLYKKKIKEKFTIRTWNDFNEEFEKFIYNEE